MIRARLPRDLSTLNRAFAGIRAGVSFLITLSAMADSAEASLSSGGALRIIGF